MSKYDIWKQNQSKFKVVKHNFSGKVLSYRYCSGCGLVNLKNEATTKRMNSPCESMEN